MAKCLLRTDKGLGSTHGRGETKGSTDKPNGSLAIEVCLKYFTQVVHNRRFPQVFPIRSFELIIDQSLSISMLSFTPVNLANIFSETRSSQSSAQITVQEKRGGDGERTPVYKESINIKHMIEFSSPPKYIIVNRKKHSNGCCPGGAQ